MRTLATRNTRNDLSVASENLKDLSSADSALKRLLLAVMRETELTRPEDVEAGANVLLQSILAADALALA